MKISIIIPTLNEARYLPKLLESIKKQTFTDYEVVVADAGSKDQTRKVAQKYKARVMPGGSPAEGRNSGARNAKGEFFFFLDADVILPKDFLQKAYAEMEHRYLDLATCEFRPLSNLLMDKVIHDFFNTGIKIMQFFEPYVSGCCIFVTKRLFHRVKGFDETVKLGEDQDFVKRASKIRPLRVLESTRIRISVRRLRKEGRLVVLNKYLQAEMYRIFKGEIRENIVEYEFGNFDSMNASDQKQFLKKVESLLHTLKRKYRKLAKKGIKLSP